MRASHGAALFSLLAIVAAAPQCEGEHCGIDTDVQDLMQLQAMKDQQEKALLHKVGSTDPAVGLEAVSVEYSLVDDNGRQLFDSHPSLLQTLGQQHLGDASTSSLRLRFKAFEQSVDVTMQKKRPPVAHDMEVTVAEIEGRRGHYLRQRSVYEGHGAVMTSVGSTLKGLLRRGDAFFELELPRGSDRLVVRTGKAEKDYLRQAAALISTDATQPLPDKWQNCYTDDNTTKALGHGIVIASKLYSRFADEDEAVDFVILLFAEANLIYKPQLNFVLVCKHVFLQKQHAGAPDWDAGPTCSLSIDQQLNKFKLWDPPVSLGLWTLLDDCFDISVGGTIGLAYVGTLCKMIKQWGSWPNVGVVWYSERTWKTFAHEVGHNFGGHHSFENGQGKTGGIMDYGDGTLNGKFQFNSQFRKDEICSTIDHIVQVCPEVWNFAGDCGNRILTDEEDCECDDGSKSCAFCNNCKLDEGAECTPEGLGVRNQGLGAADGACCSAEGQFKAYGSSCQVAGVDHGYCTAGLCIPARCQTYSFVDDFCGINPDNQCMFMCMDHSGACSKMSGWVVSGRPANYVLDQIPCTWQNPGDGVCMSGQCMPAYAGCGNGLKEVDEECECGQPGTTDCAFCHNCVLDAGKQCSPDGHDPGCCGSDGMFVPEGAIVTKNDGNKGFCFDGAAITTKCDQLKSSYPPNWGDFCGLQDNPCLFKCMYNNQCNLLTSWTLNGVPLNQLPDGTPCASQGRHGSCTSGHCVLPPTTATTTHGGGGSVDVELPTGGDSTTTTPPATTATTTETTTKTTTKTTTTMTTTTTTTTTTPTTTMTTTTTRTTTRTTAAAAPTASGASSCAQTVCFGTWMCQVVHDRSGLPYHIIDATYGSKCTGCQDASLGGRVQQTQQFGSGQHTCKKQRVLFRRSCDDYVRLSLGRRGQTSERLQKACRKLLNWHADCGGCTYCGR